MPRELVIALVLLAPACASARTLADDLKACRALPDTGARLGCYDRLACALPEVEFPGHGSMISPAFTAKAGQMLRFENSDVIFVAYLLDARGQVVQNLHQGGAGAGAFRIVTPGTYRLQVNASGGWRIWLDQLPP